MSQTKENKTESGEMKSVIFPKKLIKEINSLGTSYTPVNFSKFIREAAEEKILREKKK